MSKDSSYYKELLNKLERLTKREYAFIAALGLLGSLILGVSTFFSFSIVELISHSTAAVRTVLFFIFILITISSLVYFFIIPLFRYLNILKRQNYYEAAVKVGNSFPTVKDDLLNALQLVTRESNIKLYSEKMIDAAFKEVYNRTKNIQFESIVNFKKVKQLFFYFGGLIIFFTIFFITVPGLQAASYRLINFDEEFIPPARFNIFITPGNTFITKGENVLVTVRIDGDKPNDVKLQLKDEEQTDFSEVILTADSNDVYVYEIKALRNTTEYYVTADELKSEVFKIEVTDRPEIKGFDLTINSPAYSRIPAVEQKDNGNITALKGSVVNIRLSSTKSVKSSSIVFGDSTIIELQTENRSASGKFTIREEGSYKIILTDLSGENNSSPIEYTVKITEDLYPSIEVVHPNSDVNLPNDNRVPLNVKISDDFGFSKLLLKYRLSGSRYQKSEADYSEMEIGIPKGSKEEQISYIWNLSNLNLSVDDVVSYYLEVFDNDYISGPKSSKTKEFNVRVPSLEEILAKADQTQSESQDNLRETLKEAEELRKTLEEIDQELKKDQREITWEEKQKIEQAVKKFENLQKSVEEVSDQLKEMRDELMEHNLLSEETMKKYMELQEMMEELSSDEMKKAMEQMQQMLEKMDRKSTQQAMENMKLEEEMFQKSIERTLNLLKRIQAEQKADELVKRTEEIAKEQQEIQNQTEKEGEKSKENLQEKQQEISEKLKEVKKGMEDLKDKMEQLKDLPLDKMQELMEQFEKQRNQELSKNVQKDLAENKMQQAKSKQNQISKNMQQMNSGMRQMQKEMQQQSQMQAFQEMMKIMDNLLTLSKQQEGLKQEMQQLAPNSQKYNDNARKQDNLQRSLDKILKQMSDLGQKTFAISPEMGKALGDAKREMSRAMQSMQNRSGNQAQSNQGEAMKSLNEAAAMMKGSMEQMMQGGGQGGMMSLMQQLGQMSQQQMNLNNLTQMLQQGQQGSLSPQQQAQLQRLAQQQELIRKSAEQLSKEAKVSGESKKIPANLETLANEMKEVITGMRTENLDDKLIQKQERILSKLLDAQRSLNERDFKDERKSNAGQNIVRESPKEINLSKEDGRERLKDALNRAVQEGYTKDYEALIRKYYELIENDQNLK